MDAQIANLLCKRCKATIAAVQQAEAAIKAAEAVIQQAKERANGEAKLSYKGIRAKLEKRKGKNKPLRVVRATKAAGAPGRPVGAPAITNNRGRRSAKLGPVPTITTADLQALSNRKTTYPKLAKKYKVSSSHIGRCLKRFREQYSADVPAVTGRKLPRSVVDEHPGSITDTDLMALRAKRRSFADLAKKYDIPEPDVRDQFAKFVAIRNVLTKSEPPPTLAQPLERLANVVQRALA